MSIGLRQGQIGLHLLVLQLIGAQLEKVADLVWRVRSGRDTQSRGHLVIGNRDSVLDAIETDKE
ncbi:MAG: hypothetical protein WDO73_04930 [Ignavibacteriota bacterium]